MNRKQQVAKQVTVALDEERDLAHEHDMEMLRREQLEADCGGDMADDPEEDDDYDPYDSDYDPDVEQCFFDWEDWNYYD